MDDFTVESIKRTGDLMSVLEKELAKEMDTFPLKSFKSKAIGSSGREAKIITDDTLLTQEELNEFKQLHNKILIAQTPISSITTITSKTSNL